MRSSPQPGQSFSAALKSFDAQPGQIFRQLAPAVTAVAAWRRRWRLDRRRSRRDCGRHVEEQRLIGIDPFGTRAVEPTQQLIDLETLVFEFAPLLLNRDEQFAIYASKMIDLALKCRQIIRQRRCSECVLHGVNLAPRRRAAK